MTMKKKLLGLALSGVMIVPATGAAFADTSNIEIQPGGEATHELTVGVNVASDNGQTASGEVFVEMPTKMNFLVNHEGKVSSETLTVKNLSTQGAVTVAVDQFTGGKDIQILDNATDIDAKKRNEIFLELTGDKKINLGEIYGKPAQNTPERELLVVDAKQEGALTLTGKAGKQNIDSATGQSEGIKDELKLIFRLKA